MTSRATYDAIVIGAGCVSNVDSVRLFEPRRESFGFPRPERLS